MTKLNLTNSDELSTNGQINETTANKNGLLSSVNGTFAQKTGLFSQINGTFPHNDGLFPQIDGLFVQINKSFVLINGSLVRFNKTTHLSYDSVKRSCEKRQKTCNSSNVALEVCAMRRQNGGENDVRLFRNWCYLFTSNMCEFYENEYAITTMDDCHYINLRRAVIGNETTVTGNETTVAGNETTAASNEKTEGNNAAEVTDKLPTTPAYANKSALREDLESEENDLAGCGEAHKCPIVCPNLYDPVCMTVNPTYGGKYLKFFTFLNHCLADKYYCEHRKELAPPPVSYEDESPYEEDIAVSNLGWSLCGSSRFLAFSRFAESAMTLSHLGWLCGDAGITHIVPQQQRPNGFG